MFRNNEGKPVLMNMVRAIQENKAYLSEVDGLIGDGDHGMNMNKGFSIFEKRFAEADITFSEGLDELGMVLLNEIGGSMGPIYGTIFAAMAETAGDAGEITLELLSRMFNSALAALFDIVDARVGDKTLVDTLSPACAVLEEGAKTGKPFAQALKCMKEAAEAGKESTRDLAARYGRSSRLGERSRGVLDAGAVSCCILLTAMADGILMVTGEAAS